MFVTRAKYDEMVRRKYLADTTRDYWANRARRLEMENSMLRLRLSMQMDTGVRVVAQQFSPEEIDRLIRLCHPDKHGNSESATVMTQKLLDIRGR